MPADTPVPLIPTARMRGNEDDADAEAEFVTAPDASSELSPRDEQQIVGVVSFSH